MFETCRHELWNTNTTPDSVKSFTAVSTNSCMTEGNSNMEGTSNGLCAEV